MKLPHQTTPPPVDDLDSSNKTHAESGGPGGPATQIDETGGQTLDIATIDDGEVLVRSGTTVTSQAIGTPGAHATSHQDGETDEISVAGLSGKLADNQTAGDLATTGAAVVVSGAAPPSAGQVLKATSATVASWDDESGGGGAADALSTTGADVGVSGAAPPTTGQVLKATGATAATWQDESGGGSHASTHQNGGGDEINVGGLSGVLTQAQKANVIYTLDPAELFVMSVSDGEYLKRSGATIVGDTPAGGGAHDLGGADHNADTLANLNAKVSDATLIDTGDGRLSDARTPTSHALGGAEHAADTLADLNAKVSDATLDDQDDPRPADEIITTEGGGTTLAVASVTDGQYLKRSGATVVGDTPGGGGAADALSTSGADVSVSAAAPPTTGQVLKATAATTATWQDESGGSSQALAAAGGDFIYASLSGAQAYAADTAIALDTTAESRGDLSLAAGQVATLKAGRTYQLLGACFVTHSSAAAIPYQWYNVTTATLLGDDVISRTVNSSASHSHYSPAAYVFTPDEDTTVELRMLAGGTASSDIAQCWAMITEVGAVQANVIGGLEYLDKIVVDDGSGPTTLSFGVSGDGILGTALDGNVDGEYVVVGKVKDSGGLLVHMRPNGLDPTSESMNSQRLLGSSSTASADNDTNSGRIVESSYGEAVFEVSFIAKAGENRQWQAVATATNGTLSAVAVFGCLWPDTSTNVTSLLFAEAGGFDDGTELTLYRRTSNNLRADNASVYERHLATTVAQGTNSEATSKTGVATHQGSAIGLSVELDDTVTAGSIDARLKVGGSTVLTVTLDTTNTTWHRAVASIGEHAIAPGDAIEMSVETTSLTTTGAGTPDIKLNATLVNDALMQPPTNVVGEVVLPSAATTISLTGLDGDLHGVYEVEWDLLLSDTGNPLITAEPNGVATNQYGTYAGNFGTATGYTYWRIGSKTGETSRRATGTAKLMAARTQGGVSVDRLFITDCGMTFDADPYGIFQRFHGYWTDTANNLTSLDIVTTIASGFLAGSRVTIRKA